MGFWERWRIPLMLAPTMTVIFVLFIGGLTYGALVSLGWQPIIGRTEISLTAYHSILFSDRYASVFWQGLLLTIWVSFASTLLSAVLALATALLLRRTFIGKRIATFLYQLNLPVPHVVAAIGILFLFSQSGLLSRTGAQLGLLNGPSDFPIVVKDRLGIGIILSFVWKEVPFVGSSCWRSCSRWASTMKIWREASAPNRWQRFRYVILPLGHAWFAVRSILVFAFTFGSFEVPAILGVRFPRTLTVTAVRFFRDPDLNARTEGMAISIIISVIVFFLVLGYMWLSRRTEPTRLSQAVTTSPTGSQRIARILHYIAVVLLILLLLAPLLAFFQCVFVSLVLSTALPAGTQPARMGKHRRIQFPESPKRCSTAPSLPSA